MSLWKWVSIYPRRRLLCVHQMMEIRYCAQEIHFVFFPHCNRIPFAHSFDVITFSFVRIVLVGRLNVSNVIQPEGKNCDQWSWIYSLSQQQLNTFTTFSHSAFSVLVSRSRKLITRRGINKCQNYPLWPIHKYINQTIASNNSIHNPTTRYVYISIYLPFWIGLLSQN